MLIKIGKDSQKNILFYCEDCLIFGFHSEILNKNWIEICPAHRKKLSKIEFPMKNTFIDLYCIRVKKLTELAMQKNNFWPRTKRKFVGLNYFVLQKWLNVVEENSDFKLINGNLISYKNKNNVNKIINIFNYFFPIPVEILFLFPYLNENIYKIKIYESNEVVTFLKKYYKEINNIISFYQNKLQEDKFNNFFIYKMINNFLNLI